MSKLSTTLGSLLDVVSTSAGVITTSVDVIASTVNVAGHHASAWEAKAKADAEASIKAAPKIGQANAALRVAEHRAMIAKRCADPEFAALYAAALKELTEGE